MKTSPLKWGSDNNGQESRPFFFSVIKNPLLFTFCASTVGIEREREREGKGGERMRDCINGSSVDGNGQSCKNFLG